jgi:hypothetical protein
MAALRNVPSEAHQATKSEEVEQTSSRHPPLGMKRFPKPPDILPKGGKPGSGAAETLVSR